MNYIILNDRDYFQDKISFDNIKEVSLNGRERCDGIFGTITKEILEQCSTNDRTRDEFFEKGGLYGNRGLQFIVLKIPQDILYYDNSELIEECFRFIDANSFFTQLWSYCHKNTWEYFLIGIYKSHKNSYIFDTKIDAENDDWGIKRICQKIEEIIS